MFMAVFNSVLKSTLTSAMIFVSIIRLGMIAYPQVPEAQQTTTSSITQSQVTFSGAKRRIVFGENSINDLGKAD